jgi:hypothetical protein
MHENILKITKKLMWDYSISPIDVYCCLKGDIPNAGFYSREALLIKMFDHLSWSEITTLFTLDEIKTLLTDKIIAKLYSQSNCLKYEFLFKILHGQALPFARWNSNDCEFPTYPILSNRWYGSK